MKNLKLKNVIFILAALFILNACEEDDTDTKVNSTMVDATSYTEWTYFSLSENKVVDVTDPANDTNWDLAFMRNHVRTNSGTSGNGNGGVYDAGVVDFSSVMEAPTGTYTEDVNTVLHTIITATGPEFSNISANAVLETWGAFTEDMPPTFNVTNNVYVVKTADGKYAKLMLLNYYGTEGSGYITFKYAYQPDGSTNLK